MVHDEISFQTKIRFLGYDIYWGTAKPKTKGIKFVEKYHERIIDKPNFKDF